MLGRAPSQSRLIPPCWELRSELRLKQAGVTSARYNTYLHPNSSGIPIQLCTRVFSLMCLNISHPPQKFTSAKSYTFLCSGSRWINLSIASSCENEYAVYSPAFLGYRPATFPSLMPEKSLKRPRFVGCWCKLGFLQHVVLLQEPHTAESVDSTFKAILQPLARSLLFMGYLQSVELICIDEDGTKSKIRQVRSLSSGFYAVNCQTGSK